MPPHCRWRVVRQTQMTRMEQLLMWLLLMLTSLLRCVRLNSVLFPQAQAPQPSHAVLLLLRLWLPLPLPLLLRWLWVGAVD